MRSPRMSTLLLLPGGLAFGHLLSCVVSRARGGGDVFGAYGLLACSLALAVPFTVAAIVCIARSGARGDRLRVGFAALAVQQVAAFVLIEVVEHVATGSVTTSSLPQPALVLGIGAQLVVATAAALLARGVHTAARLLWGTSLPSVSRHVLRAAVSRPDLDDEVGFSVALWSLSRRGPPIRFS